MAFVQNFSGILNSEKGENKKVLHYCGKKHHHLVSEKPLRHNTKVPSNWDRIEVRYIDGS